MPWTSEDSTRLVNALQLVAIVEYSTSNILQTLMDRVTQYTPHRVTTIQDLLTKIENIQTSREDFTSLTANSNATLLKNKRIHNQLELEYRDEGGLSLDGVRLQQIRSLQTKIRGYLDPYNHLARYTAIGRAIH